jgi:hypothetical protein
MAPGWRNRFYVQSKTHQCNVQRGWAEIETIYAAYQVLLSISSGVQLKT